MNPIQHLLQGHVDITAHSADLRTASREVAAQGRSASVLRATAATIINLIDAHFAKEEQILFPMAEGLLDTDTLDRVARKMEALRDHHG